MKKILFNREALKSELETKGLILGKRGHARKSRRFREDDFKIEWTPSYVKDILLIINKKTGEKIYHWVDDYGRNEVKSFKECKCYKEDDYFKYEIIDNPNYEQNETEKNKKAKDKM